MKEKFDIFKGKKPISALLFPRIPMFDPVERIPESKKNKSVIINFKYRENVGLTIFRPYLSALDQKVLFTLIRLGEFVKKGDKSYDFMYDFAKVKKVAGIHQGREWSYFEKILHKFQQVSIFIDVKEDDGFHQMKVSTLAIIHYKALENIKDKSVKFIVSFSKEFIALLKGLNLFSLSLNDFKELNRIDNPVIYRIVTFFITHSKKQKWELFKLLETLTPMRFNTKDKKYRIFKAIKENENILKHYGIMPNLIRQNGKKTYILHFKKPKWLKVEVGRHLPVEIDLIGA